MKDLLKRFWTEEDGMTTVEIVIIIAVLVSVALIFKDTITAFVTDLMKKFFKTPEVNMNGGNVLGGSSS